MAKGQAGYRERTITCEGCGLTFTKRCKPSTRYCSLSCYRSSPRPERRTGEDRSCERCGIVFYVVAGRVAKGYGRYCSSECHNYAQGEGKTEHTCKICGEDFRWSPSRSASGAYRITYCSLDCRNSDPERRDMLLQMNALQQLGRTTTAERLGYELLDGLGVQYVRQPTFGGKFTPDAAVPSCRLVVQFDGDYWHDRKGTSKEARIRRRVALDSSQDRYIRACGWEVVRLWESDLRKDPEGCASRVSQHLLRPLPDGSGQDPLAQP